MMIKTGKIFSMLLCIVWMMLSSNAAWADAEPVSYDDYSFSFAIKGGISLGSYESGMNWFFIEKLRQQSQRLRQKHQDGNILKVITGASAGGINAIVSAIRFCQNDNVPAQTVANKDNLFYRVWDVELAKLLPEISQHQTTKPMINATYGFDDQYGVFHREALLGSLNAVLKAMNNNNFRTGCSTHIALPITLLKNHPQTTGSHDEQPPILRYAVPLQVTVDDHHITFRNFAKARVASQDNYTAFHKLDDFMYLSEDSDGNVPYTEVLKLALASSAFPLAFAPMKLRTCIPNRDGYCNAAPIERTFIDGGSLDNSPIGLASTLSDYVNPPQSKATKTVVVYLNPAHQTSALSGWLKSPTKQKKSFANIEPSGLQNYASFLGDLLNYGMNAQYASSIRTGGVPPMPPRHYMLAADYLLHFGAFTHQSFRKFDFYVGVYDAYTAYQKVCKEGDCNAEPIKWKQEPELLTLFTDFDRLPTDSTYGFCNNPEAISFYNDKRSCSEHNPDAPLATIACALCKASQFQADSTIEQFERLKDHLPPSDQAVLEDDLGAFGEQHLLEVFTAKQLAIERQRLQRMEQKDPRYAQQKNFTRAVKGVNLISRTLSFRETQGLWPRSTAAHGILHWLPDEVGIDGLNSVPYVNYHYDVPLMRGMGRASKLSGTSLALALSFDPFHAGRDNRNTSAYTALAIAPRLHLDNALFSSVSVGINNYYNWKPSLAGNRLWDHGLYFDAGVLTDKLHLTIIQRETLSSFKKARVTFLIGIRDIGGMLDMMSDNSAH
jgi:predicted acylesterase/phospholipase RssA